MVTLEKRFSVYCMLTLTCINKARSRILVKQSSFKAALPQPPPDIPDICNNSETWKPVEQFFDADIFEQKEQKSCGCGYRKAAVAPANHNRLCT